MYPTYAAKNVAQNLSVLMTLLERPRQYGSPKRPHITSLSPRRPAQFYHYSKSWPCFLSYTYTKHQKPWVTFRQTRPLCKDFASANDQFGIYSSVYKKAKCSMTSWLDRLDCHPDLATVAPGTNLLKL